MNSNSPLSRFLFLGAAFVIVIDENTQWIAVFMSARALEDAHK